MEARSTAVEHFRQTKSIAVEHSLQQKEHLSNSRGSSKSRRIRTRSHDKEVLELLGESSQTIGKRRSESKVLKQKVDVRAYLEDCWGKLDFHTAEAENRIR